MSLATERVAFEPFGTLDGVLRGEPIRILPAGKFYRDDRVLDVTPARLRQFAANIKAGLPRFEVPINLEHNPDAGRVGSVTDLEYQEHGADGPGLYATKYELTTDGRQLMEAGRFKGLSGETVWTLNNGAKYQDPTTGSKHDNVLVGLALTNTPFFGKEVNLYSATAPSAETDADAEALRHNGFTKLRASMIQRFKELMDGLMPADASGDDGDGGDESDDAGADAENTEDLTAAAEAAQEQEHIMAEKPEQFTLTAEQFADLQSKAADAEKLKVKVAQNDTELAALRTQSETFATKLAASERARRLDQITARVEQFVALPGKIETLSAKFLALEEKDPELYAFFLGEFEAHDKALAQGELFSQHGSERQGEAEEATLESLTDKLVAEKFDGDMSKYPDALSLVSKAHPELARGHRPSTQRGSR